ncbi:cutinase family protein [Smaragdicoccus niigatensis]|uniref:cutinase family protein n=1 Tax=Smaragdicoccus niigatensis TaxID=359359 RepID=UPI0003628836|nr:cutinase family protein [Smaragdicoccus niigatensis]
MVRTVQSRAATRARTSPRPAPRRGGVLKYLVLVVVVTFVLIGAAWYLLAGWLNLPGRIPFPGEATSQPASCPDVQVISIPGTWESRADDDPYNPHSNPRALLLNVTGPLGQQFNGSRADVYTVPYVAQFSNPVAIPPDGQDSYNKSRSEGTARAVDMMSKRSHECPLTNYVLMGFSQGAVIAGDIAAKIGAGDGPIDPDRVLGVALIADGRRVPGQANAVGADPAGVGAEVSLNGLRVPGITMTGPRDGGFGKIADRVYSVCNPSDGICNAPRQPFNPSKIAENLAALAGMAGNPAHAMYASFAVDGNGTTATQWLAGWASNLISSAPVPAHE